MPCIIVHRNFSISDEAAATVQETLTALTEETLEKPKAFIMVILDEPKAISFGGSGEPALFVEFKSIGLPGDSTEKLSAKICSAAEDLLSVPSDRVYIEYADSPRNMWGWNGRTFA